MQGLFILPPPTQQILQAHRRRFSPCRFRHRGERIPKGNFVPLRPLESPRTIRKVLGFFVTFFQKK